MKVTLLAFLAALLAPPALAAELPSIDDPLRTGSKAPADAGVVIGIEDYLRPGVPSVPYARRDAQAFNDFLLSTRGVPTDRVQLLQENASATKIRSLVTTLGKSVGEGGVAWVYFAGHGGASLNGGARMLLGDDVSQDPESFDGGGVLVSEIEALAGAGGGRVVILVDACYTGTGRDGAAFLTGKRTVVPGGYTALEPKSNVVWTAASAGQTSGPLDAAQHGAFTYFALGALRGWADGGLDGVRDGSVTMDEAQTYVQRTLATAQITSQTPEVIGARDVVLSVRAKEVAPVIAVARAEAPREVVPRTGEAVIVTDGKDLDFAALAEQVRVGEQEAADEKRRAAEAARVLAEKEAAAKALKDELERRLAAERREKIDVAAAELRAAASRDYAAISALVASPSEAGRAVLEAYVSRYRAAKVTIDSVSEAVVIAEVPKVEAALTKLKAAAAAAPVVASSGPSGPASAPTTGVDVRVVDVMLRSNKGVKKCFIEERSASGELPKEVKVKFTIQPSGAVSKAAVSGGEYAGSSFDTCLSAAVKAVVFPPMVGDAVTLTYPFKL